MYIIGKNTTLSFLKDGEYLPFLCTTDCSVTINTETKDVRTINDGIWAKKRGQRMSFSVSLTGLIELQELSPVAFWIVENYQLQMLPIDFQMIFQDPSTGLNKFVTGRGLVVTSTLVGVPVGFATGQFEIEGDGALIISNTPNNCEADIGYIAITDSEAGEITVSYDFVIDAVRFDYTIDGGERESIFDPGNSGSFVIVGIADGVHTLIVYPICENGNDGFPQEITFEMTGGGAETCDPPTDIAAGAITSGGAIVSWTATPTPADGFEWELFLAANLVTPVQSGTFAGDSMPLSGLSASTAYVFRVRSICVEGESLSSWSSVEFTTTGVPAPCNAPGTPYTTSVTETEAYLSWPAADPVPVNGYDYEFLSGITVVDSGITVSNATATGALSAGQTYTFRVRTRCADGSTSSWVSMTFDTEEAPPADNIDWSFAPGPFVGSLQIKRNAAVLVSVTSADSGTFSAAGGDLIEMTIDANSETGQIEAYNTTTSTNELSITGTGVQSGSFSVADGNNYSLTGTISS